MTVKGKHQYSSLDGVRGLAALSVLLLHYVTAFAPFLIGYEVTRRHTSLDRIVATTPLQLPVAGNLAVCVFFVLSGFVLSLKYFKLKDANILVSSAVRRYFRLAIPTIGSVLLAYFVLRIGGMHTQQTAAVTESSSWLATFWNFPAHVFTAVYQGVYGVFVTSDATYNIVLWTMHFELFGSFLVFMFLALFGKLPNRWFFYGLFGLVFVKSYYLGFFAGIVIADIFTNYPQLVDKLRDRYLWGLFAVAIVLGTWPTTSIYPSLYDHIHLPLFSPLLLAIFAHTVAATIIIVAVLKLQVLTRFFETRPLQFLGKVSFSLYLLHFIILCSIACYLFDVFVPHLGYGKSVLLTFIPSVGLTFVASHYYTKYVDERAIAYSKRFGDMLLGEPLPLKWWRELKMKVPGQLSVEEPVLVAEPAIVEEKIND